MSVQLPQLSTEQASTMLKIDPVVLLRSKGYRLHAVVYWSDLDHHFESRLIDNSGCVYRYDGMKHGGVLKYERSLESGTGPEWLSWMDARVAILAVYTIMHN
jgi:hypothetical protein